MYATSTHLIPHNQQNLIHKLNHAHSHSQLIPQQIPHQHLLPPPQQIPSTQIPQPPQPPTRTPNQLPKEPIHVLGIPSVTIQAGHLHVGSADTYSKRSYTVLKQLGDGSFGTVWLCDWHGTLPPNTPYSPMQCGAGARPEWAGKRLVAVKRMKKQWLGGWDECKKLKELESLLAIPFHPNIIPLYDFFLLPTSKELYFVFESMEGNLYHLIKARKGRALAGGLVSSIFRQIVSGLHHVHESGYFHRDMKPENVLVTTTGLFDYQPVSPVASPNAPLERDVVAIIKLADFGLARETKSKPPYTEYVSTRWYRAPEVLLLSKVYSNPIDMWAFGTIMAELVNLRPLFPGSGQADQVARICEVLGDPSDEYGLDSRNQPVGGGRWTKGVKMARDAGFMFPKIQPKNFYSLFDKSVPLSLVQCIADLLRYDPDARLTSHQCLNHPYLQETIPRNNIPIPNCQHLPPFPHSTSLPTPKSSRNGPVVSSQAPSRLVQTVNGSSTHRTPFYPDVRMHDPTQNGHVGPQTVPNGAADWPMEEYSPPSHPHGQPMDVHASPLVQEFPTKPYPTNETAPTQPNAHDAIQPPPHKPTGKLGSLGFGKKSSRFRLGIFSSNDKSLPPVEENPPVPSLKRSKSSSTDGRSISELVDPLLSLDPKVRKKEAERMQREAEMQRRALAEKMHREQARAVLKKRKDIRQQKTHELEWQHRVSDAFLDQAGARKMKSASTGPIRNSQAPNTAGAGSTTLSAAGGRFGGQGVGELTGNEWRNDRLSKVRRTDYDDDRSSSDVHSIGRMSSASFATNETHGSDPGPSRLRTRTSLFAINRMTSTSSLRTSFNDEFSAVSARSSKSFSVESQLASDFHHRASVDPAVGGGGTPLSASVSPPPINLLSLSPSLSPSPPWIHLQNAKDELAASPLSTRPQLPYISMPAPMPRHPSGPYEFVGLALSPLGMHPPSTGDPPPLSATMNPIFKVQPLPSSADGRMPSANALPPFSHMEAVAEGELSPLSPMSLIGGS